MSAFILRRILTAAFGLAAVFALLWPSLRPHPTPRYTVTDLGVLPGDTVSSASGINNHGDIVGISSKDDATTQIFLYHQGKMTSLGSADHSGLGKPTINDSGQINRHQRISSAASVSGYEKNLPHHGILYSGSRKIDFVMPTGWTMATLYGVNTQGQIIGICWRQLLGSRRSWGPFVYDSKTRKFSMLPLPPGCLNAEVNGINDHGQMTGYTWQGGYIGQAVLWNAGQPVLLPAVSGRDNSEGLGIDNQGEIVGTAGATPGPAASFVNSHNIRLRLLVPLFQKQYEDHAVLYANGKAQDLNTLIPDNADWTLTAANGINDRGQIVGAGVHHGQQRAFLLTPTR